MDTEAGFHLCRSSAAHIMNLDLQTAMIVYQEGARGIVFDMFFCPGNVRISSEQEICGMAQ